MCGIYLSSRLFWTFTQNYARLQLRSLFHSLFATLRLHGRTARDGFQVHCGTVLGDAFSTWRQIVPKNNPTMHFHKHLDRSPAFSTWRQISPQKQSHNALSQPSRPFSRATSKWRTDRAYFELLSHETFAKLNVGAIAFESISLLLPNLCLLLVIVL